MNETSKVSQQQAQIRPGAPVLTPQDRAAIKAQRPRCIWLTGLSGAGKSTLANALEVQLNQRGLHTALLDGDNLRQGLCRDLGMDAESRKENIRRIGEVARLMVDAGLIVIVAVISPFRADREAARQLFAQGAFLEIYVSTPFEVCAQRDPKGLYREARAGRIRNFTGLDSPYEAPLAPDCQINTCEVELTEACKQLLALLES
ncbi:adenylyl-sulfate kinase [Pseudomonas mediterranea]|uniref:Adenylyl-sulfate kinase n=1 Tax=Pseudomonas mediterranea TaxID=183795 RepID=A0AAX2D4I9_9PSED|nr:adenylyl-sulfate kinase [Pseudomonas mediterranea]KGU85674.1 adenylylsulfate kinase [Pseudomonas mediterranea CFBP 5447]MBL0842198.1 adenylyl-sulfate kinase [Pseudomonas mediterranea]MDU9026614.1 adenylyl-sulfate kinase [Pseudomonas mediterranea]QHA80620.1 adenylyl-sulfate kinase [Pseudomonas mediterranea]UZE01514.1 adenylyl-sulfate kinase [Pseudomonas mediterranea]